MAQTVKILDKNVSHMHIEVYIENKEFTSAPTAKSRYKISPSFSSFTPPPFLLPKKETNLKFNPFKLAVTSSEEKFVLIFKIEFFQNINHKKIFDDIRKLSPSKSRSQ